MSKIAANPLKTAINPYDNHPQLSEVEQQVLWEYSKLSDKVKRISALAKLTADDPNEALLLQLRDLEKKMGLVLTLFKASVYSVLQEHKAAAEAEEARRVSDVNDQWAVDDSY